VQCREQFNQQPWNCRNLSQQYNDTEQEFAGLKLQMEGLMVRRGEHLGKTEELLKDEDVSKDAEYTEKYTKEIDILNQMIAKKHHKIKQNNETLMALTNDIYKVENQLNSTKKILG
jgi:predicted  nucleic acid-binding Zn-ribbon protein